ncbi:MAG: hypothetical protein ACJAT4_000554 [Granulosicoccus sp.]|jgi:hypothetical protein
MIYTFKKNGKIYLQKENLNNNILKKYNYPFRIEHPQIRKNQLYNIYHNEIHIINDLGIKKQPIYTLDYWIDEYSYFQETKNGWWGIGNNSFYHSESPIKKYYRINSTPYSVSNIYPINKAEAILTSNNFLKHELYNALDKTFKEIKLLNRTLDGRSDWLTQEVVFHSCWLLPFSKNKNSFLEDK